MNCDSGPVRVSTYFLLKIASAKGEEIFFNLQLGVVIECRTICIDTSLVPAEEQCGAPFILRWPQSSLLGIFVIRLSGFEISYEYLLSP